MNILPELVKGHLYLLLLPRSLRRSTLNELTARLALRGEVQVLVAGNRFDAHGIARLIRRQTNVVDPALRRIHLARAFTCYQVAVLINEVAVAQLPTLVTDLLDTFYDENVALEERRTLLQQCLEGLRRLSHQTEVLISVVPPAAPGVCGANDPINPFTWVERRVAQCPEPAEARMELFEMLRAVADTVWSIELPNPARAQLSLF
ncbi:MAG: hypothetical protein ACPL4H_08390 [Anaerolineales bacterium]